MAKQVITGERQWFAIHTYAGYEDSVARNLKQRIASLGYEDRIFNVLVPKEKRIKMKDSKKDIIEEKLYPGYVLVEMIVTDNSWYVVRNTPGVTGFIGAGTTPTPLSNEEVGVLLKNLGADEPKFKFDIMVGEHVKITDGPFKDFTGRVSEIDEARGRLKVLVTMFGRETPAELDFLQVKKI